MKTRFTWLSIVATCFLIIATLFVGCNKDGLDEIVVYSGQVVYINTTKPFADLTVKVTNGNDTHCQTQTDAGGLFSLKVRVSEIDGNYYLLAGDSTCIPKKVTLGGYGQAEVDLGVIEVEGPALPTVKTTPLKEVTAESAALGGEVTSDGRLKVTARGICYGTKVYPTIDGLHTTDGTGIGVFSSTLKNLEHNTIYYARAYATNSLGTAYDTVQIKFTTELGVPVVITDSVYRITAHSAKCKGHVESDGGYAVSKKGTCWSKQPDPTVDDECTNDGSGKGEFTSTLSNLVENTTYYVRTYATNETSTVYGEQIVVTTLDGLPVVTTDSINSITATGFTAYGTVVSDCDIPVTARGFCYSTSQYPTLDDAHTTSGQGLHNFSSKITDLQYGTTYYVRAYATNATATNYSEQKVITTLSGLAKVKTAQVTNIGSVRATCGGEVLDDGTLNVTERGVCYGTEEQPTIDGLHTTNGKGKGTFTSNLTELKDKTTYYVRAYATTAAGTVYGLQRSFKTENGVPVVLLSKVGEPTANSVTCEGNVTGDGGVTVTERGFCYSLTQYPTNTSDHVAIGNGIGEFKGSLTGLALNSTYYVRAYAVNSLGIGYSEQQSFTTKNGLPTVTTDSATSTATSIAIGGNVTDNGGYAVTDRGICYSATNSEPTIAEAFVKGGKGNGEFGVTVAGLSASTTYYLRAYATNENGTSYGETKTIITKDGSASVLLSEVSNITALTASASVTVTDAGSATLQSCGICWSINPNPTISDKTIAASGKQLNTSYPCNLTELQPNTTYYVRAYATTDITTTYSEERTFNTVSGLPIVTTGAATSTSSTITASGEVTGNGGYSVTERGICYSKTNSEPTITDAKIASGSGNGTFNVSITTLEAATTYYVRAYATNSIGTSYGDVVPVITKDGSASVLLSAVSNITALTASASVTVTDAGGAILQSCGICWSINPNPTTSDNTIAASGKQSNTAYTCNMSGLQPSTTYYVRAYATTDVTTTYSEQILFTTFAGLPSVSTGNTISSATSITCNCEVLSNGGYSVTERGICYSQINSEPTLLDSKLANGSGNGTYKVTITNLAPATLYYIRAYATNMNGTAYGETMSVTTKTGAATVTTGTISYIKALTAIGTVKVTDAGGATLQSCGICWSTTPNPTIADNKEIGGNQLNNLYTCNMSSLTPNTTYYVRAYAITDQTTTYGNEVSFTTTSGLPNVVTNEITTGDVTISSFTCSGEVIDIGDASVTERGICWNTTGSPTIGDSHSSDGSGLGTFTHTITGVSTTSHTYYVRAYATNKFGTSYGEVIVQNKNNPFHLPTVTIGGTTYMIYPQDLGKMKWSEANTTCDNLSNYGFSDWRLPTLEEGKIFFNSSTVKSLFTHFEEYWTSSVYTGGNIDAYSTIRINYSGTLYNAISWGDLTTSLVNVRPIRIMIQ